MCLQLVLLLPALVSCQIHVNISGFADEPLNAKIEVTGSFVHIVSDKEQLIFRMTNETLRKAAKTYNGGSPERINLRKHPNPLYDFHTKNNWTEVKRTLTPTKTTIYGHSIKEVAIEKAYRRFYDNADFILMWDEVPNFLQTKWLTDESFDMKDNFTVSFQSDVYSETIAAPFKGNFKVNRPLVDPKTHKYLPPYKIGPGELIEATLYAMKVTLTFKVEYFSQLSGFAVCKCPFSNLEAVKLVYWNYDINELLGAIDHYPTTLDMAQVIKIEYYIKPKIVLTNAANKIKLTELIPYTREPR